MQTAQLVVWDLGATKCAAAIVDYCEPHFKIRRHYRCKLRDFSSLEQLSFHLEQQLNLSFKDADAILVAGAGQYNGHELVLANAYPYPMHFAKLAQQQHWPHIFVTHDYTPIVCRTFIADEQGIITIYPGKPEFHGRRVAFGIGTGLGMKDAVLLSSGELWVGTNEIGHIGLSHPPKGGDNEFKLHQELIHFMQHHPKSQQIALTFESLLSGPGLALLHQFVESLPAALSPEETAQALYQQPNSHTLQLFAYYLGLFIGVVQLAFMPAGGIWVTGGVIQKHLNLFTEPLLSHLQQGIAVSPAYSVERQAFPLKIMYGEEHAFLGGALFLIKQLGSVDISLGRARNC